MSSSDNEGKLREEDSEPSPQLPQQISGGSGSGDGSMNNEAGDLSVPILGGDRETEMVEQRKEGPVGRHPASSAKPRPGPGPGDVTSWEGDEFYHPATDAGHSERSLGHGAGATQQQQQQQQHEQQQAKESALFVDPAPSAPAPAPAPSSAAPATASSNEWSTHLASGSFGAPPPAAVQRERSVGNRPPPGATIMDEAEDCLAQSLLIFLYADLRLLSATGRINTRFENLCIDSDRAVKASAEELACLRTDMIPTPAMKARSGRKGESGGGKSDELGAGGISPAQIMAVLLVELRREVQVQRRTREQRLLNRSGGPNAANAAAANAAGAAQHDGVEAETSLLTTILDPKGRKLMQDDMHTLLRAYNNMIGEDLNTEIPKVRAMAGRHGVFPKVPGGGPGGAAQQMRDQFRDQQERFASMLRGGAPKRGSVGGSGDSGGSGGGGGGSSGFRRKPGHRASTPAQPQASAATPLATMAERDETQRAASYDETTSRKRVGYIPGSSGRRLMSTSEEEPTTSGRSFLSGSKSSRSQRQRPSNPVALERMRSFIVRTGPSPPGVAQSAVVRQEYENVGDKIFNMGKGMGSFRQSLNRDMTEDELLDTMEEAIESRVYGKLSFMCDFFREGTVSQVMVKSKAKVVWLNDWYPIKDLIYAISINTERKRVLVVFRGCQTSADWGHAVDWDLKKVPNPVKDDYKKRKDAIKIHSGFHRYLFRRRKDTNTSKYDEIATKVDEYGRQMGDYSLVVTGHSLGGALSTVFGFYASTNEKFTKNGPVKLISFGSPYVAGYRFGDAFRHQEQCQKIQHARFFNVRDGVTHLPFNFAMNKKGSKFRHVGISIKLPRVPSTCPCWGAFAHPTIFYERDLSSLQAYFSAVKNNYLLNMPLPWRIRTVHSLNEHQKRLIYYTAAMTDDTTNTFAVEKSLDELYEEYVVHENVV